MTDLLSVKDKNNCHKIFIIGDTHSTSIRERGLAGKRGGYEVHWYSRTPRNTPDVSMYSRPLRSLHKISLIAQMFYLWYLIKKIKPSLIHVFWANHNLSNIILSKHKPLIVTVMGGDILPDQRYNKWIDKFFTKMLLDKAQCITSKSNYLDKALLRIGDYKEKIKRITWGIDTELFKPNLPVSALRNDLNIPDEAVIFFSVRRCESFYKHHIIIEGFSQFLKNTSIEACLLIVTRDGKDDYIRLLNSLARKHNILSNIRFVGDIPHSKMPLYYNISLSAISIPPSDGMPQSLYESMACGCFHILGNLPQYKELIEDKINCLFVPNAKPEELARAMRWTIDNKEIVEEAAEINSSKILEIADKKTQTELMNKIYSEMIK